MLPSTHRSTDPATSKRASREIDADGLRAARMREALALVRYYPGRTSNELDALSGRGEGAVRKRLNDLLALKLVHKGQPRPSAVTGKLNETWWPERGVA